MFLGRRCRCSINQKTRYVSVPLGLNQTFRAFFCHTIWFAYRDPLPRAPGDEEKQEENLIVPMGKMHFLNSLSAPLTSGSPSDTHPWLSLPLGVPTAQGRRWATPARTRWTVLHVWDRERESIQVILNDLMTFLQKIWFCSFQAVSGFSSLQHRMKSSWQTVVKLRWVIYFSLPPVVAFEGAPTSELSLPASF